MFKARAISDPCPISSRLSKGGRPGDPEEVRRKVGRPILAEPGLDNHEMVRRHLRRQDPGAVCDRRGLLTADANWGRVHEVLPSWSCLWLQDLFFTKTARYADVILPASGSLEKEGTFTNTERRIQRLYEVLEPLRGH